MVRAFMLAVLLAALTCRAIAAAPPATLTILEGQALLYRGDGRLIAQEGVRLALGDIVETAPQAFAQLELDDGAVIQLGGATRLMLGGGPVKGKGSERWAYLMNGWLKLAGPAKEAPAPLDLRSPLFEIAAAPATVVVHAEPGRVSMFVERGRLRLVERPAGEGAAAVVLNAGDNYQRAAGTRGVVDTGEMQEFVAAMPKAFRDTLPLRAARFADAEVQARPGPDFAYADVEPWIDGEPWLRRQFLQRWRPKAREPAFRAALVSKMSAHPEWDRILFPEKYRPKPPPPPRTPASAPAIGALAQPASDTAGAR